MNDVAALLDRLGFFLRLINVTSAAYFDGICTFAVLVVLVWKKINAKNENILLLTFQLKF